MVGVQGSMSLFEFSSPFLKSVHFETGRFSWQVRPKTQQKHAVRANIFAQSASCDSEQHAESELRCCGMIWKRSKFGAQQKIAICLVVSTNVELFDSMHAQHASHRDPPAIQNFRENASRHNWERSNSVVSNGKAQFWSEQLRTFTNDFLSVTLSSLSKFGKK